jgi:hypothetical protein
MIREIGGTRTASLQLAKPTTAAGGYFPELRESVCVLIQSCARGVLPDLKKMSVHVLVKQVVNKFPQLVPQTGVSKTEKFE